MRQHIHHFEDIYLDERNSLIQKHADNAHSVLTPANWTPGGDIIIPRAVKDEEAKVRFILYLVPASTIGVVDRC